MWVKFKCDCEFLHKYNVLKAFRKSLTMYKNRTEIRKRFQNIITSERNPKPPKRNRANSTDHDDNISNSNPITSSNSDLTTPSNSDLTSIISGPITSSNSNPTSGMIK